MAVINEYNVYDREKWNKIVRSFSDYDVFYMNEYVVAFMNEDEKNGEPILLYYEHGEDHAINVVFRRDIAKDEKLDGKIQTGIYFDLISPYGYGGFWGTVTDYQMLNQTYNEYCVSKGYICEFVRFELFGDYVRHYDGNVETHTHNVIRSLELPIDEIWMDFKQKVRKNVKHAYKNSLQIVIENTGEHLKDFLDIYYSTMDRSNAGEEYYFSKLFFETINIMKDNIMYFHVMYEGKVISSELVIFGAENCYSYLGGTDQKYFELRPNDFLKFEIIKWAKARGVKNFVLGGGCGADDGIFRYKTCLAPNGSVDFFVGNKIFNVSKYENLTEIRAESNPACKISGYFPKYRA